MEEGDPGEGFGLAERSGDPNPAEVLIKLTGGGAKHSSLHVRSHKFGTSVGCVSDPSIREVLYVAELAHGLGL